MIVLLDDHLKKFASMKPQQLTLFILTTATLLTFGTLLSPRLMRPAPPSPLHTISQPTQAAFPTVDLFIRTYEGDGHWLIFLLRSFEKFLAPSAYRTIHVVTDVGGDANFVARVLALFPSLRTQLHAERIERWVQNSPNNGSYHAQMLSKLGAGKIAAGADVVCFFDSDNLVTGPLTRRDFVRDDGSVGIAPVPFASLKAEREAWQPGCEAMLKMPCEDETMSGFPMCFPVNMFEDFHRHIMTVHNKSSLVAVLKSLKTGGKHGNGWGEFSPLGTYLMATRPRDAPNGWFFKPQGHPHVRQAWSWGGFNPNGVLHWEEALRANSPYVANLKSSAPHGNFR